MSSKKLYIRTFGCQMNEYDSDKMADVLRSADGYEVTDHPEDADVILFNTCSVREKAQEKVFHDLGRVRHLKRGRPDLVIGVGGCVASQEGAAIVSRAPYVDLVFGPQTLHRLSGLIEARRRTGRPQVDISFPEIEKFDHLPPARVAGPAASVSIMEGCSKYCSFCVVPYTRGEEVSRPLDDVLTEIADLAEQGVKEVTLLGQNVNAWRGAASAGSGAGSPSDNLADSPTDSPPRDPPEPADFALLLDYVAQMPGIERIRYTTSHPREFSQRLIDAHERIEKLAPHVHLPVQAGSDRVLAAMKRGYTVLEYKSIVRRLRAARPGISISSDFIVGFPGETELDFEATMKLVAEVEFDDSFTFVYSPRPGTPAAGLPDDTAQETKLARLHRLQAAIEANARAMSARMVGTRQRVLVAGAAKKNPRELCGRTGNNRVVNFAGAAHLCGSFVELEITAALAHTLRGTLAAAA
jgi:tRNA-2-methylthio-N6-dimethylallyladenosine synthase